MTFLRDLGNSPPPTRTTKGFNQRHDGVVGRPSASRERTLHVSSELVLWFEPRCPISNREPLEGQTLSPKSAERSGCPWATSFMCAGGEASTTDFIVGATFHSPRAPVTLVGRVEKEDGRRTRCSSASHYRERLGERS